MTRLPHRLLPGLCLALSLPLAHAADLPDNVLATYGDSITLTTTDFDAAIRTLPANLHAQAKASPKSATQLLESVLLNRVLAAEARKMGLDQGEEARAELQQVTDRSLAVRRIEAFEKTIELPDYTLAAKEQYDLNLSKYSEPEQIHAAHVLIATQGKDDAAARQLADEVRTKALAGEDFGALAAKYSDDNGTKLRGGDVGFFARGRMVKPFEEAAFALKDPGQISEVIKSPFGYHVIKFLERNAARQKPFEEVKESIIAPMRAKLLNAEKARYTSKIRNDPSIKLNTAAIDRLIGVSPSGKAPEAAPKKP